MQDTIRIIIADDHSLVRGSLKVVLQKYPDFEIVGEATNGEELLKILLLTQPDILLLDLSMPNMNGLEVGAYLKQNHPEVRFIVLTMHEEPEYVIRSVQNGAKGYILKNADLNELLTAIRKVADGESYFPPKISNILIENLYKHHEKEAHNATLTPRELEILQSVANGLSTKQIAEILSISSRTVETHRINIMKKLKANNTAEMIRKALETKLILVWILKTKYVFIRSKKIRKYRYCET